MHQSCMCQAFTTLTLTKGSGKAGHGPISGLPLCEQQPWSPVSGRSNLCVGFKTLDLISSSSIPSLTLQLQRGQAVLQLPPQKCMRNRACFIPLIQYFSIISRFLVLFGFLCVLYPVTGTIKQQIWEIGIIKKLNTQRRNITLHLSQCHSRQPPKEDAWV